MCKSRPDVLQQYQHRDSYIRRYPDNHVGQVMKTGKLWMFALPVGWLKMTLSLMFAILVHNIARRHAIMSTPIGWMQHFSLIIQQDTNFQSMRPAHPLSLYQMALAVSEIILFTPSMQRKIIMWRKVSHLQGNEIYGLSFGIRVMTCWVGECLSSDRVFSGWS
jgi:hypothetical protein